MYLEVSSYRATAHVYQLCHVVVGIKRPDAALQVQVLVELYGFCLPNAGVKLVRPVVPRSQRDGVVQDVIQEA